MHQELIIYFLAGSFPVTVKAYPEAEGHNSEIVLFNSTIFLLELLGFIQSENCV